MTNPATELETRLRELQRRVTRGEPALIGSALSEAADEIDRQKRVIARLEATIAAYEDDVVGGNKE